MPIAPSSTAARRPRRLRRLIGFAAPALLLLLILPAAPSAANGVQLNTLEQGGTLRLGIGQASPNAFRHYDKNGALQTTTVQAITGTGGCPTASVAGSLAAVSAKVGTKVADVGLTTAGNTVVGLGTAPKTGPGRSGTPCGRVDQGESLTMSVGSALSAYKVVRAELDIDAKFSVTVEAKLYVGGASGTLVGTRQLVTSTGGSDSNPDCGPCDNFAFEITGAMWDTIVLTAIPTSNSNAAFSLQGGIGDPKPGGLRATLGTRDSVFQLVKADGVLACGGSATEQNGGNTTTLKLEDTPGCQPVPYNIEISSDGKEVEVRKDLTNNPNAVFTWTVVWPLEDGAYPAPPTQIDYGDEVGLHDMEICDADGPDTDLFPELPTGESYCVVSSGLVLDAVSGDMKVSERYLGKGDPLAKR